MSNVSENQALRYRRLAFYAEDMDRINEVLVNFVRKSDARCVLLIDKDGHLVARQGIMQGIDGTSLAALVAGSFASTREVAKQLGEDQFTVLFHQGESRVIHLTLVGERTLQLAVFHSGAKAGMIQVMCRELATQVTVLLEDIANRPAGTEESAGLQQGFSDQMKTHLDDLFGNL